MANPVAGFPDATNTGVPDGTNLTVYDGPMTITTPGTVIEGKIINGPIVVEAANVTIKDCSIHYDSTWGIDAENAQNITVQNCTIVGGGTASDGNSAILGAGHFIGNDISAVENGITLTGGSSTVTGNYIHDLSDGGTDPHYDGISVQGNQDGVLIENNTIVSRDTSDIFIKNDFGPINDVTVTHNLLIGDPGYDVYVDGRGGHGAVTNVSITDNYVQKGFYGDFSVDQSNPSISGNVVFAQGAAPTQTISSAPTTSAPATSDPERPPRLPRRRRRRPIRRRARAGRPATARPRRRPPPRRTRRRARVRRAEARPRDSRARTTASTSAVTTITTTTTMWLRRLPPRPLRRRPPTRRPAEARRAIPTRPPSTLRRPPRPTAITGGPITTIPRPSGRITSRCRLPGREGGARPRVWLPQPRHRLSRLT